MRLAGDSTEYANESKPGSLTCNGTVVVRSLQWPGALTFYHNESWHQVYVGTGHKYEQAANYYPVDPPTVLDDPEEFELGPEPTPLEEPEPEKGEGEAEGEVEGEGEDED